MWQGVLIRVLIRLEYHNLDRAEYTVVQIALVTQQGVVGIHNEEAETQLHERYAWQTELKKFTWKRFPP